MKLPIVLHCVLLCIQPGSVIAQPQRVWRPTDSIAVRYFVTDMEHPDHFGGPGETEVATTSPDGTKLLIISRRGDLSNDSTVYSIFVYDRSQVLNCVRELIQVDCVKPKTTDFGTAGVRRFSANSFRWSPDSDGITFAAGTVGGQRQVFHWRLNTGVTTQVSHSTSGVTEYLYSSGVTVYSDRNRIRVEKAYPGELIYYDAKGGAPSERSLSDSESILSSRIFAETNGRQVRLGNLKGLLLLSSISPDGRTLIRYSVGAADPALEIADTRSGEVRLLSDVRLAPGTLADRFSWSSAGRSVAISNTEGRLGAQAEVSLNLASLALVPSRRLLNPAAAPYDRPRVGDRKRHSPTDSLMVALEEGDNTPPNVRALVGPKSILLFEPDPALANIRLSPKREVEWREQNGKLVRGSLTLPVDFKAGQRVPLIIQAYYYYPGLFRPDGPLLGTADAGQALAARGFAVLQTRLADPTADPDQSGRAGAPNTEAGRFVTRVDAIIDLLTEEGIVDPDRVGLIGFSRSGYQVYQVITRLGKHSISAAVAADSALGSYDEYLDAAAYDSLPALNANYEKDMGMFWENKTKWLAQDPSFNVDKVVTPILFTANNNGQSGESWAANWSGHMRRFGAFRRNDKPVEYAFLPRAEHAAKNPLERLYLITLSVDWMAFWLKGEIDDDVAKRDQFSRWRALRVKQEAAVETARAQGRKLPGLLPLRIVHVCP